MAAPIFLLLITRLRRAGRDVAYCAAGLAVSVVLAFAATPAFRASILE